MAKKSDLSAAERAQLVLRLLSKEEPAVQIARRAGVSEQTLYRWRDEFISGGKAQLGGRGVGSQQEREARAAEGRACRARPGDRGGNGRPSHFKKTLGRLELTEAVRTMVKEACDMKQPVVRLSKLLGHLGIACSSWYAKPAASRSARAKAQGRAGGTGWENPRACRDLSLVGLQADCRGGPPRRAASDEQAGLPRL